MTFNNGFERKRFEANQKALRAEYEKLGMSEEQMQALYDHDLAAFNSDRKYITHTQPLSDVPFPEDGDNVDDSKSALLDKFLRKLSTNIGSLSESSRYGWIDEIDDPALAERLTKLSAEDKELLTLYVFDELNQSEIAEKIGISQRGVSKRLQAIAKKIK